jgi:hypothetical protein
MISHILYYEPGIVKIGQKSCTFAVLYLEAAFL